MRGLGWGCIRGGHYCMKCAPGTCPLVMGEALGGRGRMVRQALVLWLSLCEAVVLV